MKPETPLNTLAHYILQTLPVHQLTSDESHKKIIAILIIAIVILSFLLFLSKLLSSSGIVSKADTILICGPQNAGKTTLYYQLKQDAFRETYASMMENIDTFLIDSRPFRVVDLAGHISRRHLFSSYVTRLKACVFVVDGSDESSTLSAQTVNFLFDILTDPQMIRRSVPLLICVNKTDQNCMSVDKFTILMENALNKARDLRSTMAILKAKDGEENMRQLGNSDGDFTFRSSQVPVEVCQISAKEQSIQPLRKFITRL